MKEEFKLAGNAQKSLTAATLGFFFGAMAISLFGPSSGVFADSMNLSPFQIGLLVAVPSLSGSLLRIPLGATVDVNGGRKSFITLMILSVIGLIGLSLLFTFCYPDNMKDLYYVILLLGCLSGCGIATFSVGASQTSYWFVKSKQGFALGIFGGLGTASAGVLALALPAILKTFGFTNAYYILTFVMLLGCIIYIILSNNAPYFQLMKHGFTKEESKIKAQEYGQELFPAGNVKESLRISAKIPQTWMLVATYFTTFGGFIALTSWFPTFWQKGQSLDLIQAGLLTATFAILAALCRIPGGKMADKLGGVKVSIFSLVVVAITGVIMTLPLGWIPLFICTIVMAVAFGFNNAAVMKLVPVYVSQSVGGASGWIGGLGAFGGFVIPPLMGKMTELYPDKGYGLGFILFTIFSLLNIAINYLGMIRKK
jgi:MFS transporter, NNP family, nitrate/nitrite transporter